MATIDRLALLQENTARWMQWKNRNPQVKVDLSNANLTGTNLQGVNLAGVNLKGANLSNANL